MTEKIEAKVAPAPIVSNGPQGSADLSEEIVKAIEKRPEDRVTCRRIWGNSYRCNWWAASDKANYDNPNMSGQLVTTHTIRKSRFLNVTKGATGLVITEPAEPVSN